MERAGNIAWADFTPSELPLQDGNARRSDAFHQVAADGRRRVLFVAELSRVAPGWPRATRRSGDLRYIRGSARFLPSAATERMRMRLPDGAESVAWKFAGELHETGYPSFRSKSGEANLPANILFTAFHRTEEHRGVARFPVQREAVTREPGLPGARSWKPPARFKLKRQGRGRGHSPRGHDLPVDGQFVTALSIKPADHRIPIPVFQRKNLTESAKLRDALGVAGAITCFRPRR